AEHTGLVGGVRRLEGDRGTAAAQALQGRLLVVDQCHDDVAGVGGVLLADHHEVAVEDASLDHRVAAHLQGIVLAARDHVRGQGDRAALRLDGRDRRARRDPPHHRDGDGAAAHLRRSGEVGRGRRALAAPAFH
ncbi:hypothetical protein QU38_00600, partial [Staphylococcus aureus]